VITRTGISPATPSPNLDLLRATAVLLVYFFHLFITTGSRLPDYIGQFGVLLFFVHTSLVLMFSLERIELAGRSLLPTFYLRRLFRIYPLSIVCVSVIVLFQLPRAPWWPWAQPDLATIFANLFLYTEFMYKPVVTSVLWSLPYEVAMYVVLPFLYLAGKAYGIRGILALWCLAVVGGMLQPYVSGRLEVIQYAPCFIAGVACYFFGFGTRQRRLPLIWFPLMLLTALGILAYGNYFEYENSARWILCLLIGLTSPFFAELNMPVMRKGAAWIARYSYGIYLTHLYAQWTAFVVLKDAAPTVRYATLIVLSVGLPIALYHLIEAPMVRLGARLADRIPKPSVPLPRPIPSERRHPVPATANGLGAPFQPARHRTGHSSDHRTTKTAQAPASAN
jgi:peptidoglycan/LPS O-acetylase OafA/YrhL